MGPDSHRDPEAWCSRTRTLRARTAEAWCSRTGTLQAQIPNTAPDGLASSAFDLCPFFGASGQPGIMSKVMHTGIKTLNNQ